MQLSMKKPICSIFDLYAAIMQQYAAAVVELGIMDSNYPFVLWNDPNNGFQSILTNNQWKIQYATF